MRSDEGNEELIMEIVGYHRYCCLKIIILQNVGILLPFKKKRWNISNYFRSFLRHYLEDVEKTKFI